jgi:hypothetical protein
VSKTAEYVNHETRNTIAEIRGILDGALAWTARREGADDADMDAIADARRKLGHILCAVADVETMIKNEDQIAKLIGESGELSEPTDPRELQWIRTIKDEEKP